MTTEAIILAGGLGTRLRSAVPLLPKCMAMVAGQPFINYVLRYLATQGVTHFILAVGYKAEPIQRHIQQQFSDWNISFSNEEEPLGTGGAIAKACRLLTSKYVIVVNGDTLYKADLKKVEQIVTSMNAECLLLLKPMKNIDRYGVVEINDQHQITRFREKQFYSTGLINGGIYILNAPLFLQNAFPKKFSFEKEYLEPGVHKNKLYGIEDDTYFIDIGTPEDFRKANLEL